MNASLCITMHTIPLCVAHNLMIVGLVSLFPFDLSDLGMQNSTAK